MTEFLLGGTAAACAGIITNPLEVVKTRVQLQGELKTRGMYKVHYKNVLHAFYALAKAEGILALQKGLAPAIAYQFCMNGVRLGVFQCIENLGLTRDKNGDIVYGRTVIAGALSGCTGSFVGSPFYLVKTHLQSQSSAKIAVGHQHHHSSFTEALNQIYARHGLRGLWRGAGASMTRVTVGSSVQLSTFSKLKRLLDEYKIFPSNSLQGSFCAACIGGLAVSTMMTPFDVVSTRLYNQPVEAATGRGLVYLGIIDCASKIFKTEGVGGFYKGWSASFLRIGPHTVLSLCFWQEIRKYYFTIQSQLNPATSGATIKPGGKSKLHNVND